MRPKPGCVSGSKEDAGKPPPTHHPAVREDLPGVALSIDPALMFPPCGKASISLSSPYTPVGPLSSPSHLCCWSAYLWLGEFTVDSRAVLSRLCCGFGQGPQAVRGWGGSPNLIPRRRLEPIGQEVNFPGDLAHSRPRSPPAPQPPPTSSSLPPPSTYGLKMNSGVHAIIAAIGILLHTKVSILTLVLSLTYIVKSC